MPPPPTHTVSSPVRYSSGKEGGKRHHRLPQFPAPRPALGHFAAGTSETLFLTYFRRRLGAINNQQRRRNAAWAETSPATSRSRGPGAAPRSGLGGRIPCPAAEAAEPPAPPRRPPARAAERLPEFSCRGAGRGGSDPHEQVPRPPCPRPPRQAEHGGVPACPSQPGGDGHGPAALPDHPAPPRRSPAPTWDTKERLPLPADRPCFPRSPGRGSTGMA